MAKLAEKVRGPRKVGVVGTCFICSEKKLLVPGHKVCSVHHKPGKCNVCRKMGKNGRQET